FFYVSVPSSSLLHSFLLLPLLSPYTTLFRSPALHLLQFNIFAQIIFLLFRNCFLGSVLSFQSPGRLFRDLQFGTVIAYHVIAFLDRKSTRLNSSHVSISYAVFCLIKKITNKH